jgi:16S rRNA (guanine1207-N2)-methyltransferase
MTDHAPIRFQATLRGETLQVISSRQLEEAGQVSAAAELCARLMTLAPAERMLVLGAGNGALGVALARLAPAGHVTLSDPHLPALRAAAATLAANGVANAAIIEAISLVPEHAGACDRVVLITPQSRGLARRWLVEAHALLRPSGALTVAGAKHQGVQSVIGDATALFGASQLLGYGSGCRVVEAIRQAAPPPAPAWAADPGIAPGTWHEVQCDLPGGTTRLVSLPGVFSSDRLDAGTAFLLDHMPALVGARVLDIGCGYGPLGIAAAQLGAAHVTLQDVNLLAVAAAAENCRRLNLPASVRAVDGVDPTSGPFDCILSNPPFHAGKRTETAMAEAFLLAARQALTPGGRLRFGANSFLPYAKLLRAHGVEATLVADNRRYQVIEVAA